MKLSVIYQQYLIEQQSFNKIKLYHSVANKKGLLTIDLIKSVINNGLIRNDNGEMGNVIWFSKEYNDYSKGGDFVLSIEYNEKNKEKYQIYYDNHNGYAYKDIPFEELDVIKIPVLIIENYITSSDDLIRLINENIATVEKFNNLKNVIIYNDIFNVYVQPYINIENFIDKIDNDNIKIINILE